MSKAHILLTDSGGIQEEAPTLGKPVLVVRDTTERPEGVQAGTLRLVDTDPEIIRKAVRILMLDPEEYARLANADNPFGDGKAANRIVDTIAFFLGTKAERGDSAGRIGT